MIETLFNILRERNLIILLVEDLTLCTAVRGGECLRLCNDVIEGEDFSLSDIHSLTITEDDIDDDWVTITLDDGTKLICA